MGSLSVWHLLIVLIPLLAVGGVVALVIAVAKPAPIRRVQPGWYPDPQNPQLVRWHDGVNWTSYQQPR